MEFKIYTVPFSTYPRVNYACKHLDPLLRRYDEIYLQSNKTSYRDYTKKQEFKLCLQSLGGDKEIDVGSVTKQNDEPHCIQEKCDNVKELVRKGCLQNSFVIIVASDINEDDIPTYNNVGTICLVTDTNVSHADWYQGMHCVSKEKVYEKVSATMESILYKASGMKSKCEYLLQDLNKIFEKQQTEILTRRSMSVEDIILGAEENVPKRTSSAKERNIFETIKQKESLSDEMLGMFSRSLIPVDERPHNRQLTDKRITKELKEELKSKSGSIRSCGYRGCTLVIFVDEDCDPQNLKASLKYLLKKHNIESYSVEPLNIKEFSKVGSTVEADFGKTGRSGTLGGFGCAKSRSGNESKTIGLVSRHVVSIDKSSVSKVLIRCEGKTTEASVDIDNSFADKIKPKDVLDIAAISFKEDSSEFDLTYKTSENKSAKGVLTTYTTEQMKGLPVQICGAYTPLGRGTVTMPKIEGVRDICMDENYIFVEDNITEGNEKEVFCKELDSGAIVCTDDQDNPDNVQLISMVIGENIKKKGSYATLKLKEGIKQVEEETNSTIELL